MFAPSMVFFHREFKNKNGIFLSLAKKTDWETGKINFGQSKLFYTLSTRIRDEKRIKNHAGKND